MPTATGVATLAGTFRSRVNTAQSPPLRTGRDQSNCTNIYRWSGSIALLAIIVSFVAPNTTVVLLQSLSDPMQCPAVAILFGAISVPEQNPQADWPPKRIPTAHPCRSIIKLVWAPASFFFGSPTALSLHGRAPDTKYHRHQLVTGSESGSASGSVPGLDRSRVRSRARCDT